MLPRDSGQALSRWSATELARQAQQQGIVKKISPATVKRWLRAERIKPWQSRRWQGQSDPRFLEKVVPILQLYEQAQALARAGHLVVCVDEKTSIQARALEGGVQPAQAGQPLRAGDHYRRWGALQLFAGLHVARGQTLVRCFAAKRFVEFQSFLRLVFTSVWCRQIACLHLILDNGSTHAPKQLAAWIATLKLGFAVKLHWLPVHASWLDQIEIVFSQIQKKVLTPNHYESLAELERTLLRHLKQRNHHARPIVWSYTVEKLLAHRNAKSPVKQAA